VNWDEKSANGTEPDHPAPVLQLAAAAGAQPATVSQTGASQTETGASAGSPSWPGITGLIAGLAALVVAVAALITARSRGRAAPPA
jgi:hypothetical protein